MAAICSTAKCEKYFSRLNNNSEKSLIMYMRNLIDIAENNWRTNVYDWIQNKQNNINY